jgi:putative membrane protein
LYAHVPDAAELKQQCVTGPVWLFYQHNLHRTRDASGVLFLISIFEKKIHVLADSGIYTKIEPGVLNGFC